MKETLAFINEVLDSKKAIDIRILDISRISSFANYFIICSGANEKHIQTLADEVREKLGEKGVNPAHVEGFQNASWILMEYFDIIVHIFSLEAREYYELERLWADGAQVDVRTCRN